MPADAAALIADRAARAGLQPDARVVAQLAEYLALLAFWNRRINLTSLPVDPPTDAAIDRLIVEPLLAARVVEAPDRRVIDLGSGGGSPAIPFKIAAPQLRLVMVESRTRKGAFLREAVRALELGDASVETARFEELASRPEFAGSADLLTVRAVRADEAFWGVVDTLLAARGRLIWFGPASDLVVRPNMKRHESASFSILARS